MIQRTQHHIMPDMAMNIKFLAQQAESNSQMIDKVGDYIRYQHLQNGQALFHQGDQGSRFYIILQGNHDVASH
jgi:CRP-like cAMP-binding protein